MPTLWFIIVAFMLAVYVVLDGFDLGAGIVHLLIAKNDDERRIILRAIGPVWDGNEVWLLAAGGTLYFAFPLLYASSFSGFYLPLMIVLWLLMLRGLGIEFRHQIHHPMWTAFWDATFSLSSLLLAIFFGAALGNVVRGVPLDAEHYFFEPLWTTFAVEPQSGVFAEVATTVGVQAGLPAEVPKTFGTQAGILDWFTTLMGLVAMFTLTVHGANYISMKTEGEIRRRSRSIAAKAWWGALFTSILALTATSSIRPQTWGNYANHGWGFVFPLGGILGLAGMYLFRVRGKDTGAFLASSLFIVSMLCATAFGLYPNLLPASTGTKYSITIENAAAQEYGLTVGLVWWTIGILLATGYFVYVYRSFRGKVTSSPEEGNY